MRRRLVVSFALALGSITSAVAGCVGDSNDAGPAAGDAGDLLADRAVPEPAIDAARPDTGARDANAPDTSVADVEVPDTNVPDTNVADANVPDTNVADTDVADTNVPDADDGAVAGPTYTHFVFMTGSNSIEAYGVDLATGKLAVINQTPDAGLTMTVPTGSNPLASAIAGATIYTSNASAASVSAFTIDHGLLTRIDADPFTAGVQDYPAGSVPRFVVATSKFVFTADEGGSISRFAIGAGGTLTSLGDVALPSGASPKGIAVDPTGTLLFSMNYGLDTISAYAIDAAGGLTIVDQDAKTAGQQDMAVPTGAFTGIVNPKVNALYVTCAAGQNKTQAFSFDAKGVLSPLGSPVVVGSNGNTNPLPFGLAVDPAGTYLYIVSYEDAAINVYALDPTTGAPTAAGTGTGYANSRGVTVDPAGAYLYVSGDNAFVTSFAIDPKTGVPASIANVSSPLGAYAVPVIVQP